MGSPEGTLENACTLRKRCLGTALGLGSGSRLPAQRLRGALLGGSGRRRCLGTALGSGLRGRSLRLANGLRRRSLRLADRLSGRSLRFADRLRGRSLRLADRLSGRSLRFADRLRGRSLRSLLGRSGRYLRRGRWWSLWTLLGRSGRDLRRTLLGGMRRLRRALLGRSGAQPMLRLFLRRLGSRDLGTTLGLGSGSRFGPQGLALGSRFSPLQRTSRLACGSLLRWPSHRFTARHCARCARRRQARSIPHSPGPKYQAAPARDRATPGPRGGKTTCASQSGPPFTSCQAARRLFPL